MAIRSYNCSSPIKKAVVRILFAVAAGAAAWVSVWAAAWWWEFTFIPSGDAGTGRALRATVVAARKGPGAVSVRIEQGPRRGEVVTASAEPYRCASAEPGRACLVCFGKRSDGSPVVEYLGPRRERILFSLIAFTAALGVLVMGRAGLATFGSLALGAGLIAGVFIPLVLRGWPPVPTAGCIAVPVCIVGLLLIGGANLKSLSAVIGCSAALLLAAWLPRTAGRWLGLTGLDVGFGRYFHLNVAFWYSQPLAAIDFSGLLIAGMILTGLGATMDVSMCVASSVFAVPSEGAQAEGKRLFRVGTGVGRDILGVMAITVVLAVVGTHFEMLFLARFAGTKETWAEFANLEDVASELVRVASAVVALALAIPLTSFAAAVMRRPYGRSR